MFHKPEELLKRTPADGINRPEFLRLLVQEFRKTNSAGNGRSMVADHGTLMSGLTRFAFVARF